MENQKLCSLACKRGHHHNFISLTCIGKKGYQHYLQYQGPNREIIQGLQHNLKSSNSSL